MKDEQAFDPNGMVMFQVTRRAEIALGSGVATPLRDNWWTPPKRPAPHREDTPHPRPFAGKPTETDE